MRLRMAVKQRVCWSWLLSIVGANAAPIASGTERIQFHEIHSAALGRSLPVAVLAPVAKSHGESTPVLYFLHGRGRHHRSLLESATARSALLAATFYIVLPQGEDGWYIDSTAQPEARYSAYLAEVIAWAERALPISKDPGGRGIAGWSMGGYGAVRFAQTHRGDFGFVASVIGLLDFPRPATLPEGQNYQVPTNRFGDDPEAWAQLNPLRAVEKLRGTVLMLVLATRGFERTMNENFIAALETQHLSANVHWLDGGHEFSLVERAVPLVVAEATKFFGTLPR
jgi:S-formylglutathione hydrolase FrmB